ncbi:hypothetical protein EYS14_17490 [Alteromonadaceae bacterium M269]|nr:hypothetical protein EYS14_17490 [Alteromonadaceae bacterium M269]
MALESVGGSAAGASSAALRSAQLANEQTRDLGQQTIELIESAGEVAQSTPDISVGSNVDTFA